MTDNGPETGRSTSAGDDSARRERDLVARAAAGDGPAFAALYRLTGDSVYRFVLFRVRDEAAAEDVTQEVFIRAYRSLGKLRDPGSFRPWITRIAHNCVIDFATRRDSRPETAAAPDAAVWNEAGSPEGLDPDRHMEHVMDLETVLAACERLTDLQRQVIALRFISGLSVAETAAIMGRSANAIHNLQHHALAGLRRQLAPAKGEGTA